jgi:hypothetical protein
MSSPFASAALSLNAAQLAEFGEPITYQSYQGPGPQLSNPILDGNGNPPLAIPHEPKMLQSGALGYWADIEVDPAVIPNPQRYDQVTWADGNVYQVGRRSRSDQYSLWLLSLHKADTPPQQVPQ